MSKLSVGIVGFPNVGKSTLFNALLKKQVAFSANYPFATIEPNVGVALIKDPNLDILAKVVDTDVIKNAYVEFFDIAGLVKGAHKGEGLGNKFLSHIRTTNAILHVLRDFKDKDIIREGTQDPKTDLENIRMELILSDIETLSSIKEPKGVKDKKILEEYEKIQNFIKALSDGKMLNTVIKTQEEESIAKKFGLLTAKPELIAVNIDEEDLGVYEQKLSFYSDLLNVPKTKIVLISALFENELLGLEEKERQELLESYGIKESSIDRLAKVAFDTLGLQTFYTAGKKEVKAWIIKKGTTAVKASAVIHTDFEKLFIRAKVVDFDDFVKVGGWTKAKEFGKIRLEGKDYIMKQNDVVEFLISK